MGPYEIEIKVLISNDRLIQVHPTWIEKLVRIGVRQMIRDHRQITGDPYHVAVAKIKDRLENNEEDMRYRDFDIQ